MTISGLDLFFKEIKDEYSRENFYKLKRFLDNLDATGTTTVIGGNTSSASSPWTLGSKAVGAGVNTVLDFLPVANMNCAYYFICFKEQGGVKTKTLKIDIRRVDMDVEDQVYAKNGDSMNIALTAVIVGTNMELQIQNNEAFGIDVEFTRLNL